MKTNLSFDFNDVQRRKIAYFLNRRYGNGKSHGRALATRQEITEFINNAVDLYWNSVEDMINWHASDAIRNNITGEDTTNE